MLELANIGIKDEGAMELGKNTTWVNLLYLELSYNVFGLKELEASKNNPVWPKIIKISSYFR